MRLAAFSALAGAALVAVAPAMAGTLQVGAYPSNPPWELKTETGEFEGFEVDLAHEIADRMGMDIELQNLGFQALFAATSSGRIDFAISSITITDDRLQNQAFTQGYYDSDLGVVTGAAGVGGLDGLEGRTVGAIASSIGEKWIKENGDDHGFGDYRSYSSQQGLLLDVVNGRVAAGIGDILGFQFAEEQMPGLHVVQRISTGQKLAIMLPKGSDRLDAVNGAISEIKKDGTMADLYRKWLKSDPPEDSSAVNVLPVPRAE